MSNYTSNILLYRGTRDTLTKINKVYPKNTLIVELLPEDKELSRKELFDIKRRFKIGDGIHSYNELPYELGFIPVAFKQPKII